MRRALVILAVVAAVGTAAFAAAATLTVNNNGTVQAGASATGELDCDGDGVDVGYTVSFSGSQYVVDGVTIGNIDAGCNGKTIKVTTLTSGNVVIGTAQQATINATSMTLTGFASPAKDVDHVAIAIVS